MGAPSLKSTPKITREERDRIIRLKHKYENRITIAKYGKESLDAGDYGNALKKFMDYLHILAEVKEVNSAYELRVDMFNPKKEITEMLMISHIFFEMARLYDAVPKFKTDVERCLELFVHFSANQPYQVVNSELVRKYLKKSNFKNPEVFRHAHQQIFVQSKKCYIVTFCYGNDHLITHECREFKDWLLNYRLGQQLVRHYYRFSSVYVPRCEENIFLRHALRFTLKPLLLVFSKVILPVILR